MQRSFTVADLADSNPRVMPAAFPLDGLVLNVLAQVRKAMHRDDTEDLAREILAKGQLSRGRVVALTYDEAKKYVTEINALWQTKHRLDRMHTCVLDGQVYYLFVIFGHRRLEACKLAYKMLNGKVSSQFDGRYRCDIFFGLTMLEAVVMQFGENQYVKPSQKDDLAAMWQFWRFMKRQDPSLSVRSFAKKLGRKVDKVTDMLKFAALPDVVQERINPHHPGGAVSYQVLLQVSRLVAARQKYNKAMTEEDIIALVNLLVVRRVKASDYAKEVTRYIESMKGQQDDLFGDQKVDQPAVRRVAEAGVVRALHQQLHYLFVIDQMAQTGAFGGDSPLIATGQTYSPYSPARMSLRLIKLLQKVAPMMAERVRSEGRASRSLESGVRGLVSLNMLVEAYLTTYEALQTTSG